MEAANGGIKNNAIIYATSSVYSPIGVSLYGLNDSKYLYIKENSENRIISLIDKNNKKRLDKVFKVC